MLLQLPYAVQRSPRQIIFADDCFQQLRIPVDRVYQVVLKSTEKLFGSMFYFLYALLTQVIKEFSILIFVILFHSSTGQLLKHENLWNYFDSKVLSLKAFHNQKTNGETGISVIRSLVKAMNCLQR